MFFLLLLFNLIGCRELLLQTHSEFLCKTKSVENSSENNEDNDEEECQHIYVLDNNGDPVHENFYEEDLQKIFIGKAFKNPFISAYKKLTTPINFIKNATKSATNTLKKLTTPINFIKNATKSAKNTLKKLTTPINFIKNATKTAKNTLKKLTTPINITKNATKSAKNTLKKLTTPINITKNATKSATNTAKKLTTPINITKNSTKAGKNFVKKATKSTESSSNIASRLAAAYSDIVSNPSKAGSIIKAASEAIENDLKASTSSYTPLINNIKIGAKRAFKAAKAFAPCGRFVILIFPSVGQVALSTPIARALTSAYKAYKLYQKYASIYHSIERNDLAAALRKIASTGGAIGATAHIAAEAQKLYAQFTMIYEATKSGNFTQIVGDVMSTILFDAAKQMLKKNEYYRRGANWLKKGKAVARSLKTGRFWRTIDRSKKSYFAKVEGLVEKTSKLYKQGKAAFEAAVEILEMAGLNVTQIQCSAYYDAAKKKIGDTVRYLKQAGDELAATQAYSKVHALYTEVMARVDAGMRAYEMAKKGKTDEAVEQLKKVGIDIEKNKALASAMEKGVNLLYQKLLRKRKLFMI